MEILEQPTTLVSLTEAAAVKVKDLLAQEPAGEAEVLRIAVQGGGCSGFEYALGFDHGAAEGDLRLESNGVSLVVDPYSAPYLQGAEIDKLATSQEAGVKTCSRIVASSCGCGQSFQGEEGEAADAGAGCGSGCSH